TFTAAPAKNLTTMSADEVGAAFSDMLASPGTMVGWMIGGFDCFWNLCTWLAGRYGKNHESHDEYSDRVDCHSGDSFSGVAKRHGRCKIIWCRIWMPSRVVVLEP
ncbi:MAG: hypothetical protein V8R46_08800, partial [Eubacterium ramulus]